MSLGALLNLLGLGLGETMLEAWRGSFVNLSAVLHASSVLLIETMVLLTLKSKCFLQPGFTCDFAAVFTAAVLRGLSILKVGGIDDINCSS